MALFFLTSHTKGGEETQAPPWLGATTPTSPESESDQQLTCKRKQNKAIHVGIIQKEKKEAVIATLTLFVFSSLVGW